MFKGCMVPKESYRVGISFVLCDTLFKIAMVPIFPNLDDYFFVCVFFGLFLLGYNIVSIYWKLQRQSLRSIKKFPAQENYTLIGLKIFILLGLCLWSEYWFINEICIWEDPIYVFILATTSVLIGMLFLTSVLMRLIRLDRIKVPAMRSLQALRSNQTPIILLRSFELDKYTWWNNKTFDEDLCGNIDVNDCPIISLSDPDQFLPTGGSLKIQSKDDFWKSIIEELLKSCRAIVIVEGDSAGLSWEIEKIKSIYTTNPDKVFFYIPANKYRALAWCINEQGGTDVIRNFNLFMLKFLYPKKQKRQLSLCWDNFRHFIQSKGFNAPDNFPGDNTIIAFNSDSTSTAISSKKSHGLFDEILKKTTKYKTTSYNYKDLAETIASYEVNGFMSESQIKDYHKLASKVTKTNYFIASAVFVSGILTWFII